ncbi:class I SAM-dependent methyltransferase [Nonomuraea sp. NPDC049504]|uniref:class I SAM-dependent methyltransferase n=1 Tax=Nonomuraea sp. NPDC049504 TaxID=3154729 RepID=UPI0034159710
MADLFGGAAPSYAKYRTRPPEPAIAHLAAAFGADSTVLDLGCGPGTLAIPLAGRVREVLAVDPDHGMLAEGRRLARRSPNVRWIAGDSARLGELPAFDHVVMGRSFHWMDRRAVLAELDALLPRDGVVVLVGPAADEPEQPWEPAMRRVRDASGINTFTASNGYQATGEPHEAVLSGSPFRMLARARFEQRLTYDVTAVVGPQLSYSYTAPAALGGRLEAFAEEAGRALLADRPSGRWDLTTVTEVVTARRPPRSP